MRYIRTTNNYVEFIEANNAGNIITSKGFQFGELYFQIKNGKVTFYLNDQENPWRNDVWSADIPLTIDDVEYATEDETSAALHNIMNDSFQEQLDQLSEDLAAESARAEQAEEDLGEEIDDERDRATSAETFIQTEVTELSGTVATFDERITRVEEDMSAFTDNLTNEIARSTGKDAEHDTAISGLTNTLNSEIQRALSAETSLHNEIIDERNRALLAESGISNNLNAEIQNRIADVDSEEARALEAESALTSTLNDEIARSTAKDASQDAEISGLTTSLQNEINRSLGADNSLRNDLNSEISARTSADTALVQRVTALEVGKADANSVYTKTESDNKYATKDYLSGLTENIYTKGEVNTLLNDKADKVSAVSSAMYNSQSKTIDFKNISGTVISSIDARDFIKDGMVDNVEIVGNNLVITFNTDAGKEAITVSLASIFDPTNYYNKAEIDAALSGKASTGDVATISGDVQTISGAVTSITADLTNYYTKSEVDASQFAQDNKIDALSGEVQTISGSAITSGEVQTIIDNSISGKTIDYLSAGTNVQINNNVISATDTKYTAGSGITITGSTNKITLDANIYKGSGSLSVSINNPNGSSSSYNQINGNTSIGAGYMVKTTNVDEAAFGISNISTYGNAQTFNHSSASTLFSVGNGNYNDRHNAIEIKQNGDIYIADTSATGLAYNYPMIKLQDAIGGGSGSGVTSGEVQTMIDNSISGKADTSAVTASLLEKVNVVDNEVPDYYVSGTSEYTRYFPSQSEHATYANGLTTLNAVGFLGFGSDSVWHTTIEIINEQGQTISGSCNLYVNDVNNTSIVPTALTNYMTATVDKTSPSSTVAIYTLEDGWKISWVNMYTDRDYDIPTLGMTITNSYVSKIYDGGQSEYVIENVIEPELVRLDSEKQNKLSAGTNVQINNNVISATDTTYSAGDGISISNSNVISTVTKFWCGTEQEWGQISGGTLDANTIYMVH